MIRHRTLMGSASLAVAILAAACGAGPGNRLETRTFSLESLSPEAAVSLLEPYILSEGATIRAAPGNVRAITVRERPEILGRIEATLAELDRAAAPAVALHFQIIEAGGFDTADPRIADVEAALRELFRFQGYRLAGEGLLHVRRFGDFNQRVGNVWTSDMPFYLQGHVRDIRHTGDGGGSVSLDIQIFYGDSDPFFSTKLTVPLGQTFVIGSGKPLSSRHSTYILAVRPEIHR
jgi:hypothetical protein